jgi:hypothetical protein
MDRSRCRWRQSWQRRRRRQQRKVAHGVYIGQAGGVAREHGDDGGGCLALRRTDTTSASGQK